MIAETLLVTGAAILALVGFRWWPKKPKRNRYVGHKSDPSIRVPRETLWGRTNRYHARRQ